MHVCTIYNIILLEDIINNIIMTRTIPSTYDEYTTARISIICMHTLVVRVVVSILRVFILSRMHTMHIYEG